MADRKRVVIVGVGALGSHVTQFLRNEADLVLIDFDRVEQKNVLSQFHAKVSVGKNKAGSLREAMSFLYGVKVEALPHKYTEDNRFALLKGAELILDCLDNAPTRRLVQESACGIPVLHGALAADGAFGRVGWDDGFSIDEGADGAATCEGGEHLPFIAQVSSYIALAAQEYLRTGKKRGYSVYPTGAMAF